MTLIILLAQFYLGIASTLFIVLWTLHLIIKKDNHDWYEEFAEYINYTKEEYTLLQMSFYATFCWPLVLVKLVKKHAEGNDLF